MSEQSPQTPQDEEREVEGHLKAARNEDPSVLARKGLAEEDGPEVEGHFKTRKAADPSKQA